MKGRTTYQLKRYWSALPSNFWFVPSLIVAGSIALAMVLVEAHSTGNAQWLARWRGSLQTIASLTASPNRRQALREHAQWIAELAERTLESPHDRARFESRLARVREALEAKPLLCAGAEKENHHTYERIDAKGTFHTKWEKE